MTPAEEVAYLRRLAAEITADTRISRTVRLVVTSVITARADRIGRGERA